MAVACPVVALEKRVESECYARCLRNTNFWLLDRARRKSKKKVLALFLSCKFGETQEITDLPIYKQVRAANAICVETQEPRKGWTLRAPEMSSHQMHLNSPRCQLRSLDLSHSSLFFVSPHLLAPSPSTTGLPASFLATIAATTTRLRHRDGRTPPFTISAQARFLTTLGPCTLGRPPGNLQLLSSPQRSG